jgi:cell division protein FtsI/penicillin-binding protein 2
MGKVFSLKEDQLLIPYATYFSKNRSFLERLHHLDEAIKAKIGGLQSFIKQQEPETIEEIFVALQSYKDLTFPLYFSYRGVPLQNKYPTGQALVSSFIRVVSPGHARSWAYRQATTQGSIFKLITAYTALKQRFKELKGKLTIQDSSFFELIDKTSRHSGRVWVGNFLSGQPIPQIYKGGRIPKSVRSNIGRCDLFKAMEMSSNPYFSLLASEYLNDPEDLVHSAKEFGYGEKTGIALPGEIAGKVPDDIATNKTGLYSFAIGQHTLVTTPLQAACVLSALACEGNLVTPKIVELVAGRSPPFAQYELIQGKNYPYKEPLETVGVYFPLFIQPLAIDSKNEIVAIAPEVRRTLYLPQPIRRMLFEGMHRVVTHVLNERTGSLGRFYQSHPHMYHDFAHLKGQFIGKTSTAESQERIGIDIGQGSTIYNHTWFGGISFEPSSQAYALYDSFGKPELIVVVYLRYGGYGKEVAPIAAQVVKKWREIRESHGFIKGKRV